MSTARPRSPRNQLGGSGRLADALREVDEAMEESKVTTHPLALREIPRYPGTVDQSRELISQLESFPQDLSN